VKVTAILAAGPGGVIGRADGSLFVNCKHDMQFFKEQTHGHNVVMGRNTFESLPGAKGPGAPLPNRHIIVVTGNKAKNGYSGFGYEYVYVDPTLSTSALIELLKSRMRKTAHMDRLIIAGGAYVYNRLLENGDVDEVLYSEYSGSEIVKEVTRSAHLVTTNYDSAHDLFNTLNKIGRWVMEIGTKDEVQVTPAYNKTSFTADYQLFKMTKEIQ
jgi:dihydrofolate reductase